MLEPFLGTPLPSNAHHLSINLVVLFVSSMEQRISTQINKLTNDNSFHQRDSELIRIEEQLRQKIVQARQLAQRLHCRLDLMPSGELSKPDHAASRMSLALSSAEIVATLNSTIKLLISISHCPPPTLHPCIPAQGSSNLSHSVHSDTGDLPLICSQPHSSSFSPNGVPGLSGAYRDIMPPTSQDSFLASQCSSHVPACSMQSSVLSICPASVVSQVQNISSSKDVEPSPYQTPNPNKRKSMEKFSKMVPVIHLGNGQEMPVDDGYEWRKYGQKLIWGMQYPRNYYRCAHRKRLSCMAVKQVQKCNDCEPFFYVTYKGCHTCEHNILPVICHYPAIHNATRDAQLMLTDACHKQSVVTNQMIQLNQKDISVETRHTDQYEVTARLRPKMSSCIVERCHSVLNNQMDTVQQLIDTELSALAADLTCNKQLNEFNIHMVQEEQQIMEDEGSDMENEDGQVVKRRSTDSSLGFISSFDGNCSTAGVSTSEEDAAFHEHGENTMRFHEDTANVLLSMGAFDSSDLLMFSTFEPCAFSI